MLRISKREKGGKTRRREYQVEQLKGIGCVLDRSGQIADMESL